MSPAPMHAEGMLHGEEYASIKDKLVALASYAYALYCEHNANLYFSLEEAVRGTSYASSFKPFQQVKSGRGSLASIKQQFAGSD
eukprot:5077073-Ditylum_brightwellii.AAC.1